MNKVSWFVVAFLLSASDCSGMKEEEAYGESARVTPPRSSRVEQSRASGGCRAVSPTTMRFSGRITDRRSPEAERARADERIFQVEQAAAAERARINYARLKLGV